MVFSGTKPLSFRQILRDLLTIVYLTDLTAEKYSHQHPPHAHAPRSRMNTGPWVSSTVVTTPCSGRGWSVSARRHTVNISLSDLKGVSD